MDIIENRDAQFLLLAGFIIAVGLVITTMLLNSIAFEGNMAGEAGSDPVKYDIANLMQVTADEMRSANRSANGSSQNFTEQMQNFNGNLSKMYALHGEGVNISNWSYTPPILNATIMFSTSRVRANIIIQVNVSV